MAYNKKLADRVEEALAHLANVEQKKMFGGIAFVVNGKMCINVGKDRIMCRIDPALHDEAIRRNGVRTVEMRGRQLKGYININEETLKTRTDLEYWIALALDFNKIARASKKK